MTGGGVGWVVGDVVGDQMVVGGGVVLAVDRVVVGGMVVYQVILGSVGWVIDGVTKQVFNHCTKN